MTSNNRTAILAVIGCALSLLTQAAWAQTASEVAKLLASDGANTDYFGISISMDGDTAVIGAPRDGDNGALSGSAYVFTRSGSTWTQQAKLLASDGASGDFFGQSVSISGDTAVIGAYLDDTVVGNAGSAYVFTRSGTTWTQQAKLVAADAFSADLFGFSVSIDGDTAMIGAVNNGATASTLPGWQSGSTYVFTRSGSTWTEQAKLKASNSDQFGNFGFSVSIDGDTAVIGAIFGGGNTGDSGSAYVFTRSGTTWTEQARLFSSDGGDFQRFGHSVAIDGDTAVIGERNVRGGPVFVFTRSGSTWTEQARLGPFGEIPSGGTNIGGEFGWSVSVDGDTVVVGAATALTPFTPATGQVRSGLAYVFTRSGSMWTRQAEIVPSDAAPLDLFGASVSIDGDTVLIGARNDENNGLRTGSTYVYNLGPDAEADADADGDGILDTSDNCPADANADQADNDGDGIGDVCDPDDDNDGILDDGDPTNGNAPDNCQFTFNPDQFDGDGDGAGDVCDDDSDGDGIPNAGDPANGVAPDNCPLNPNPLQEDYDGDGLGDACDPDDDNDGVPDDGDAANGIAPDNCRFTVNPDQADLDGDNIGDICDADDDGDHIDNDVDNCPVNANTDQLDTDWDGLGDACDSDDDGDGIADGADNCALDPNFNQMDWEGDGLGDVCDPDDDNDRIGDLPDNCPLDANTNQADADGDGTGDACDADDDNDGVLDDFDNCPVVANADQLDGDGDGLGDACDSDLDGDDLDGDGISNAADNCPADPNFHQADQNGDGTGDICDLDIDGDGLPNTLDNCPVDVNVDQADNDGDGLGDHCDYDDDNDGQTDSADTCPLAANPEQIDSDYDVLADACDPDDDNDNVADGADVCPITPLGEIVDPNIGCSIAQTCPCEGPRGTTYLWSTNYKYVACTRRTARSFVEQGLISGSAEHAIVLAAENADCGSGVCTE